MLPNTSEIGSANIDGSTELIAALMDWVSIADTLPAPSAVSIPKIGPLTMITGRKKISLKKPLPWIFIFSIMAMISANTTIIGVEMMVDVR